MLEALSYLTQQHPWFWLVLGGVAGAVLGSFANCARYRLPRGLSLRRPVHSFCPACRRRLTLPDLVPIASWLVLRGRCRTCRAPIGVASLGVETALALAGVVAVWLLLQF